MSEFKEFRYVIRNIKKFRCVLEDRPKRYMFGCNNYGDIPGVYNRADGDPWDIFAPGYNYKELKINREYRIKRVIGYLKLDDGNHKIAVLVYVPGYSKRKAINEIRRYTEQYTQRVIDGEWVPFDTEYEI